MPLPIIENLMPLPLMQPLDNNGAVVPGGLMFTYANGTTTKLTTYTDATGATPNTNPIIADPNGRLNCWVPPGSIYTLVWCPSTDTDPPTNSYWTRNNLGGYFAPTTTLRQRFVAGVDFTAGTTTQLTLNVNPLAQNNTWIFFDGVYQDKTQYSLSGATITFTAAIPTATAAVEVMYWANQASTTYLVPSDIGVTVQGYSSTVTFRNSTQTWTMAQRGSTVTLSNVAGSTAVDLSLGNNFTFPITTAALLSAPSNVVPGQAGVIVVTQPAATTWALTYNAFWKWPSGTPGTLSTVTSAVDAISYYVASSSYAVCNMLNGIA